EVADSEPGKIDRAGQRLEDAGDAAEQRRLAGAVRTDHGKQRAGRNVAREMMHGRMPVIAERHVAKADLRGHSHAIASEKIPHRPALTASAAASRAATVMRRIDHGAAC